MKNNHKSRLFEKFVSKELLSGIILISCTIVALIIANSSVSSQYFDFWHRYIYFSFSEIKIKMSLGHFINDGLMSLFFLMVGLEIKREISVGELNSPQRALFPVVAALGGMFVPALIYSAINLSSGTINGFGVPMATDIAFVLGVLTLLGNRISLSLKIFLVSLAIVDDMGAVLVIALAYSKSINISFLLLSIGILVIMLFLNKFKIKKLTPYILLGLVLWFFIYKSGVHATIAGVLTSFIIPINSRENDYEFLHQTRKELEKFEENINEKPILAHEQHEALENIAIYYDRVQSPLVRLEHLLHPISAFIIMPLFAFSNAGIRFGADFISNPNIFWGVFLGLSFGKALGIVSFTFIAHKMRIATKLPTISWSDVVGAGLIAGIGFTMSIFISFLAFDNEALVESAKGAILIASVFSALIGTIYFILKSKKDSKRSPHKA